MVLEPLKPQTLWAVEDAKEHATDGENSCLVERRDKAEPRLRARHTYANLGLLHRHVETHPPHRPEHSEAVGSN